MFTIYNCVAYEHDLRLVVLAALVCALASFAAINFLNHVRKTTGYMRDVWLCVAATASGFGIWATHFIAMLAYSPGIPSGYNIILTILSLLAAILLTRLEREPVLLEGLFDLTRAHVSPADDPVRLESWSGASVFRLPFQCPPELYHVTVASLQVPRGSNQMLKVYPVGRRLPSVNTSQLSQPRIAFLEELSEFARMAKGKGDKAVCPRSQHRIL